MTEEEERNSTGPLQGERDRLDFWFCRIAGAVAAVLLAFCLFLALQTKPSSDASVTPDRRHVVG